VDALTTAGTIRAGSTAELFRLPDIGGRGLTATGSSAGTNSRALGDSYGSETRTITLSNANIPPNVITLPNVLEGVGASFLPGFPFISALSGLSVPIPPFLDVDTGGVSFNAGGSGNPFTFDINDPSYAMHLYMFAGEVKVDP
jgi:hypothetical protein